MPYAVIEMKGDNPPKEATYVPSKQLAAELAVEMAQEGGHPDDSSTLFKRLIRSGSISDGEWTIAILRLRKSR